MQIADTYISKLLQLLGCCFFFMLFTVAANAQARGSVEVIKDPRLDSLVAHKFGKASKQGIGFAGYSSFGYRVQIYTGSNRAEAFKAQTRFQESYPDTRTYISYSEPNFKVRVGDFRTRLEASKMVRDVKAWFPLTFIISEKINPPKLDIENQNK